MSLKDYPLVSICCITYNHEKYIESAIKGFLLQKTSFPIEIIIHDDASSDTTQETIRKYTKKDKRIISILRKTNIKSTGVPVFPITFKKAKGKYIALCEGDDYWTDPLKLQKQVDFLEANPSYSMSSHSVKTVYEGFKKRKLPLKKSIKLYIRNALVKRNLIQRSNYYSKFHTHADFDKIISSPLFIALNSMVIKSETMKNIPDWFLKLHAGHMALILIATSHGPNYHFSEIMGVKRKNPGGITQNPERMSYLKKTRVKYQIFMYENLNQYLNFLKSHVINKKLRSLYFKQLKKDLFSGNIKESIYYLKKTFSLIGK